MWCNCIILCIDEPAGRVKGSSLPGCDASIRRILTPAGRSWKTVTLQFNGPVQRGGVHKYDGCQTERWGDAPSIPVSDGGDAAPASTIPAQTYYASSR